MQRALELTDSLLPQLANDFQRRLLTATMQSVQETSNPLRLNNFSASFRELFRHVLIDLAPEHEVRATSWFQADQINHGKTTRAQKISYVIHAGLDPVYVENELGVDISTERKALLDTIDRLSKFTHVNEESFASSPEDVMETTVAVCEALKSFLNCADEARKLLCRKIEERVHEDVVGVAISETILSIDEIATHHCIDEVDVHEIEITSMNHAEIEFTAFGSVDVELQWGSNSDVRNGAGAVGRDSYPLTCKFISNANAPEELVMVEDSLCVDTSSWWDGYYDEEVESG
jgi:Predicted pPIWI-associating nuclease